MWICKRWKQLVLTSLVASVPAMADIRPLNSVAELMDEGDDRTAFGDRTPGTRGVLAGDVVSVALQATALNGVTVFANGVGDAPVIRGNTFVDIGAHRFGTGRIQARWDELINSGRTYLQLVIRTSDQSAFFPANANIDGFQLATWNWRVGLIDPIDYEPQVQSVQLLNATALFSRTWGQSYFGAQNFTAFLSSDFQPGVDFGSFQASIGDGMNSVLIRYEVDITVPSQGTIGVLAAALTALTRRRR